MIFPISSVIQNDIENYNDVLVSHTGPLMDCIEWDVTGKKNVLVTNDTIDLYRFFDCTKASEFLYECTEKTIEDVLSKEIKYLERFDKSYNEAIEFVDMPDHDLKQLLTFIAHNDGKLSERKRKRFFDNLPEDIQTEVEDIVRENFEFE